MAEDFIRTPETGMGFKGSKNEKKALKFYLSTERVVCAKACGSIVIDGSLILSFFSELIPFTVMLFTTLKEFGRKTGDKSLAAKNFTSTSM